MTRAQLLFFEHSYCGLSMLSVAMCLCDVIATEDTHLSCSEPDAAIANETYLAEESGGH